jgi:RIP homotypic interaction motif
MVRRVARVGCARIGSAPGGSLRQVTGSRCTVQVPFLAGRRGCDDGTVKWRVLTWVAVVVAVAAAADLVADLAVGGPGKASALAGVIAGFCELGALVLGVSAWAGQRRSASEQASEQREPATPHEPERAAPERDGAGAAPESAPGPDSASGKYVVDARLAQGVQIGDGNTQRNDFRRHDSGTDER